MIYWEEGGIIWNVDCLRAVILILCECKNKGFVDKGNINKLKNDYLATRILFK